MGFIIEIGWVISRSRTLQWLGRETEKDVLLSPKDPSTIDIRLIEDSEWVLVGDRRSLFNHPEIVVHLYDIISRWFCPLNSRQRWRSSDGNLFQMRRNSVIDQRIDQSFGVVLVMVETSLKTR